MNKAEVLSVIDNEINNLNQALTQVNSAYLYIEVKAKLDTYKTVRDFIQNQLTETVKETKKN